jgi:hypothetical protein
MCFYLRCELFAPGAQAACAIHHLYNFFRRVLGRDKAVSAAAAADAYLFYLLDWKVSAKFHAAL